MKPTFDDLEFKDRPMDILGGIYARMTFDNGYGISVVRGIGTYGSDKGLFEAAVLLYDDICYTTDLTDDVLGNLTPEDITELMSKIIDLPKVD